MPHRIRLHTRWKLLRDGTESVVDLPLVSEADSRHELTRSFGKPANLSGESVWIRFEEATSQFVVKLNGTELGRIDSPAAEWEVTASLNERNEVRLESQNGAGLGSVMIEIRGPS